MKTPKPQLLPSGRWFIRLRLDGQNYSRTFDSAKEAEAWALSTKAQYKANQLRTRRPDEQKTVRQLVTEYLASAALSENTRRVYGVVLNHHFRQILDRQYNQVANWQKVINLELQTCSPNSVDLYWSKIAVALRFHDLPVPSVKIPKKQSKQKNYLTPEQIPVFMDAVKGNQYEVYFLMMLCSMRVSEALSVTKEDMTEKGIHVKGTKTDASDRVIPWMIPRIKELPLVPTTSTTLTRELKKICTANGLPDLSCHSLRVAFATTCYMKGVPERIAMKVGGWSNIQTMHRVYVRISESDVQKYVGDLFR